MALAGDLEGKYQKLASEYSKVRSQAAVLKKAVLDEQAKNNELKELMKQHEQTIRKHDQEMESLTFRNEQLNKRITVLQQELQVNNHPKKNRSKTGDSVPVDSSVLDEELQKKILENAQLVSSMADKEYELADSQERIKYLEKRISSIEKEYQDRETKFLTDIASLKQKKHLNEKKVEEVKNESAIKNGDAAEVNYWKEEAERWRCECELLRSKPTSNSQLSQYYESQLEIIRERKELAESEAKSVWAENSALYERLENLTTVNRELGSKLENCDEELRTTTDNYKSQLDAMTEHLAAQNDKITQQCDEIQALKHRLHTKK